MVMACGTLISGILVLKTLHPLLKEGYSHIAGITL